LLVAQNVGPAIDNLSEIGVITGLDPDESYPVTGGAAETSA
jgi:hypothetical protein